MSAASVRLLRAWLVILLLGVVLLCPGGVGQAQAAANIEFRYTEIVPSDQVYVVNAAVDLQPKPRLQDLIEGGVTIPFRAEFILTRPRWYWFSETIVERVLDLKLSYHALTRQYRVSIGSLHRNFTSFDEAMRALLSVHNWAVVDRARLQDGESYTAAIRFRLDLASLPKPFQIAALGSNDLDLTTGWVSWIFLAGQARDSR